MKEVLEKLLDEFLKKVPEIFRIFFRKSCIARGTVETHLESSSGGTPSVCFIEFLRSSIERLLRIILEELLIKEFLVELFLLYFISFLQLFKEEFLI